MNNNCDHFYSILAYVRRLPEVGRPFTRQTDEIACIASEIDDLEKQIESRRQEIFRRMERLKEGIRANWTDEEINKAKEGK